MHDGWPGINQRNQIKTFAIVYSWIYENLESIQLNTAVCIKPTSLTRRKLHNVNFYGVQLGWI